MSLFIAFFVSSHCDFEIYVDMVRCKLTYKIIKNNSSHNILYNYSSTCHNCVLFEKTNEALNNNIQYWPMYHGDDRVSSCPNRRSKGYNELRYIETSPYDPFKMRQSTISKRLFVHSTTYHTKSQAIGEICAVMKIPYEQQNDNIFMTCDEFDAHVLDFAKQQVCKYEQRFASNVLQEVGIMIETLQQQLSVLEHRIDDLQFIQHEQELENSCQSDTEECDKETTLTPNNIVELAIQYHKKNKLSNTDIVETIQLMLSTRQYTLGQDLTQNKIDFAEANTLFLASVAPTKLEKNDLQNLIFKNVVCDSLI